MPLEGFVQAIALQQNILQQLIENGVLKVDAQNTPPETAKESVDGQVSN
ncbi:MAG: hypothetical protein LLG02_17295 [Pelosinus sp.]|nr:hypothetical protein [Pelosinus sp.]